MACFFTKVVTLYFEASECGRMRCPCIKCWSSSDSVLMVIEVAKVVLKVKTDLLMNAVTAATNTHFYVLSLSPLRKCLTFF